MSGQRNRAFSQCEALLRTLCDLTVLLDTAKDEHSLYSMRGTWNRPGIRGLQLDRGAVERAFRGAKDSVELAAAPLIIDELGVDSPYLWFSSDPLPLDILLASTAMRSAITRTLLAREGIAPRLRVAARWFAEAFWSTDHDDSALALGVAVDALIGSRSGLPRSSDAGAIRTFGVGARKACESR